MLGHEDVSEDLELMLLPCSFQCVEEDGACVFVVEAGETVIATEGEEVVMAESVGALEVARHVGMIPGGVPRSWTLLSRSECWKW